MDTLLLRTVFFCPWEKKAFTFSVNATHWGMKTESEKKQRIRKREHIGNKMEEELLPMECTERQANKTVTVIEETPCACVSTYARLHLIPNTLEDMLIEDCF